MDAIVAYFANDPLKILYALGGAGGIWFWLEKWLERIRLRVRPLNHSFDTRRNPTVDVELKFEAVNLGKSPTSLEPYVFCSGFDIHRKMQTARLEISNEQRLLEPHCTQQFTATGVVDATYIFWLFKTYRICPTRGADRVIYTRSFPHNQISRLRYHLELMLYRGGGWLPFLDSTTDER